MDGAIRANLLDAEARMVRALAVRDALLAMPEWERRQYHAGELDRATREVDEAAKSLAGWKALKP